MNDNELGLLLLIAMAAMVLAGVRRRREQIRHNLRGMAAALVIGLLTFAVVQSQTRNNDTAFVWAVIVIAVVLLVQPKRSRYIPAAERRKARAQFELSGKKYNPRKHHFHHDVPYSKGGSNTADNLRVVTKRENLKRGSKSPWWDLLGR